MESNSKILIELGSDQFKDIIAEAVASGIIQGNNHEGPKLRLPKYLTRAQASEILGIHINTLGQWERKGKIRKDKEKGIECYLTTKILQLHENRLNQLL